MRRVQSPWKPWKDAITKLKGILARNVTNEKQWGKSLPADLVFICVVENPSWGVSKNSEQPELRLRSGPYIVVWSRDSKPSGSEWSYQREYDQWREASYPWLQERDSSWSTKLKLPCSKATALLGSAALHLTACCWLYADQGSVAGSLYSRLHTPCLLVFMSLGVIPSP